MPGPNATSSSRFGLPDPVLQYQVSSVWSRRDSASWCINANQARLPIQLSCTFWFLTSFRTQKKSLKASESWIFSEEGAFSPCYSNSKLEMGWPCWRSCHWSRWLLWSRWWRWWLWQCGRYWQGNWELSPSSLSERGTAWDEVSGFTLHGEGDSTIDNKDPCQYCWESNTND